MRVGILTFHKQLNCGAALQTYALKRTYEQLGAQTQVIDFYTKQMRYRCRFWLNWTLKGTLANLYSLPQYPHFEKVRRGFMDFAKKNLNLTQTYSTYEALCGMKEQFDILSSGSDQVFNYFKLPKDQIMAYTLQFDSTAKHISYAASFGNKHVERQEDIEMLRGLDAISLREGADKELVEKVTGKEVSVVLDPTLLPDKSIYSEITEKRMYKRPYILCYFLTNEAPNYRLAEKIKSLTGLDIVVIALKPGVKTKADKIYRNVTPPQFLSLVENASFVVTNSFHGTSFSLIYEKPFFVYAVTKQANKRVAELLGKTGLENRLVCDGGVNITEDNLKVDFSFKREALAAEREKSIAYIKEAFEAK